MSLIILLLSYWMAISKFNDNGESEQEVWINDKRINEFCMGPTWIWGTYETSQSCFNAVRKEKGRNWCSVGTLCFRFLTWYSDHTFGTFSRIFFLRKSSIFMVLISSGRHNNLTFFWHHLSLRASRLLCWKVISHIVLHLLF